MEFARIAGGKVIALDINEQRIQFCKDKLKVAHSVNARRDDSSSFPFNNEAIAVKGDNLQEKANNLYLSQSFRFQAYLT
jgi:phosphopantetheinyl transferase